MARTASRCAAARGPKSRQSGRRAALVRARIAPGVAITGDPAQCVAEIARRRQFGIDLPILNLPTKAPWDVVEAFIRAMAPR